MANIQLTQALNWADSVAAKIGLTEPPMDLNALARKARATSLKLRIIIPRGALVPVTGGFEIYVRDLSEKDIDISTAETRGQFTTRQRFVIAHEIAHTWFYDANPSIPVLKATPTNPMAYEQACNRLASRLLVPSAMLKRDIQRSIQSCERIDTEYIRGACDRFGVSPDVLVGRLEAVEPSNVFERCILLARKEEGVIVAVAAYFGMGLAPLIPRPKIHNPIHSWLKDLPTAVTTIDEEAQGEFTRNGRQFGYKKQVLSRYGDFLLQIDALPTHTSRHPG